MGQTAVHFVSMFPKSTIFSFEPEPVAFKQLQANVRLIANVTTISCALGSKKETRTMCRTYDSGLYRFISERESSVLGIVDEVEVPIDTVDCFCRDHEIERVDLLKTDTEGYDLEVLKGATNLLERGMVNFVYSECEFESVSKDSHTNFFELYDFLRRYSFNIVAVYTECVNTGVGYLWGGALFMRNKVFTT